MKEILKKNQKIVDAYVRLNKSLNKKLVKVCPEVVIRRIYKQGFGEKINLKSPRKFSEKLMWLNLYWKDDKKVICTDKYEVRNYVKEKIGEKYLNQLYGVYNTAEEIQWDKLPERFVLKATHGSGTNIICKDKSKLDKQESVEILNKWLKTNYALEYAELHYSKVKPRIICEKFIETENGGFPIDYKIYCFNGKPKLTLVCLERATGKTRLAYFDNDWQPLNYNINGKVDKLIAQPVCFKEMLEVAQKLSEGIPFVRVDLYEFKGQVLFGEMTFTPRGCLNTNIVEEAQMILGEYLELPSNIS